MGCKANNLSAEELRNYVKNRKNIYDTEHEQDKDKTLSFLTHTTENIGLVETEVPDKSLYGTIKDGIVLMGGRVTDAVNRKFIRSKGKKEAERINSLPDNILKSEVGTFIHNLAQRIIELNTKGVGSWNDIVNDAKNSKFGFKEEQVRNLEKGIKEILKQIKVQQDSINTANGTKEEATIISEQIVIDPTKDLGGSIDILALYSDNTASIFDFKAMSPRATFKKGKGKNAKIISEEWIPWYKEESFRIQQSEYRRILEDVYGVKKVRQTRIVPIHVEYQRKKATELNDIEDVAAQGLYTGKVLKLAIGEKQGEFLKQLPVGFESTGFAGLDKLIRQNYNIIEKAQERQGRKGLKKGEWEELQQKINRLKKANKELILKADFNEYYSSINTLMTTFAERELEPEYKDGKLNPKYLTKEELHQLQNEFIVYDSIVKNLNPYIRHLKKTDQDKYFKLQELLVANRFSIESTLASINDMIEGRALELIDDKYKDEYGNLLATKPESLLGVIFNRTSEFAHPIFKKFKELIDKSIYKKRQSLNVIHDEIAEKQQALFAWAKQNGMSKQQAFNLLVNKETGNMHSHLKKEFWEKHNTLFETNNVKGIKALYEFRNEAAWESEYESRLEQQKDKLKYNYHNLEDYIEGGDVIRTAKQNKRDYERDLKKWEKENNLHKHEEAWLNERNRYYLKFKDDVEKENYSDEYKYIVQNKPLKDFYDMFTKYTTDFRNILGLTYSKMPNNFIPNIRRNVVERLNDSSEGNIFGRFQFGNSINEMIESLQVREEDVYIGARDLNTGELEKNIPVLFTNPFRDSDGNINNREKSYDLGRVLYLFANMTYNHKYMSEIEADVIGLKHILANSPELNVGPTGKARKTSLGEKAVNFLGATSDIAKAFEKHSDYYLYGIKFSEKQYSAKILGKELNSTKALLAAKSYFSAKSLGLPILPAAAAWIHGRTGIMLEGKKGIAFTTEQSIKAKQLMATDFKKYHALARFIDPHVEDMAQRGALKLTNNEMVKYVNSRSLYSPLRYADENIDNFLVVAMSQNYGFDENGNMRRLANLPEGTRSIWERMSYDEKTGQVNIEGLTDSNYMAFRNAVKEVGIKIKGAMSNEDVNQVDLNIWINLGMQFKTWMPGILRERFGSLRYNDIIDSVDYGRYRAVFSEFEIAEGVGFMQHTIEVFLPRLADLILDLGTFGLGAKMGVNKRVNEERSRLAYESWKADNPSLAADISFEDFLDIKHRQIKAAIVEMRVVFSMLGIMAFLGAEGDDGRPNYTKYWITRKLYQVFSRAESEIAFAMNPAEFIKLTQNPFPMMRLLSDIYKTINNTMDESRDLIFGENEKNDKTPIGYYSSQWIIGVNQFRKLAEIYEQDKQKIRR